MFIQTEQTPNPATLKFIPGCEVMLRGTAEFKSMEEAQGVSPLAASLLKISGITGVFLARDFISATKAEDKDWRDLSALVMAAILDHFTAGLPVMLNETAAESSAEDSDVVRQIKEILDTRVRPAVAMDGGDIVFHSFEDGIVYLHMQGACAGCPSSTQTLKAGIENLLKHFVPEVTEVRPAQDY